MSDNEKELLRMLTEAAQRITNLHCALMVERDGWKSAAVSGMNQIAKVAAERDEARADVGRLESRVAAAEERAEYWREKAIPSQEAQRDEEYRALVVDRDEWKSAAKMGADEIALLEKERDTLQQRLDTIQVTLLSAYDGDAKNAATASEKLVTVGVVGLAAHIKTSLLVRANRVRELEAERDNAREEVERITEDRDRALGFIDIQAERIDRLQRATNEASRIFDAFWPAVDRGGFSVIREAVEAWRADDLDAVEKIDFRDPVYDAEE